MKENVYAALKESEDPQFLQVTINLDSDAFKSTDTTCVNFVSSCAFLQQEPSPRERERDILGERERSWVKAFVLDSNTS